MRIPLSVWIAGCCLMALVLLIGLRSKKTGRSALYSLASALQYAICFLAAAIPALASVIEELPGRFWKAWQKERGETGFGVVRSIKSA